MNLSPLPLVRPLKPLLLAAGLFAVSASAAPVTWDVVSGDATVTGGTGTWDLATANWTVDGGVGNSLWDNTLNAADTAVFGGTAGTVTLNNGGAAINAGGVTFSISGYTVAGATAGDKLNFGAATGVIDSSALGTGTTTNANLATISAGLSGSAGITLAANGNTDSANGGGSTGRLDITGDNSALTGGITITSGLVRFYGTNAAGNNTNTITLNGGGLLVTNASGQAAITLSNAIAIGANGGTLRAWASSTLTLSGQLSGSGVLNKTDNGAVLLNNSNNGGFTGTLNIQAGTVRIGNINSGTVTLGASAVTVSSGATLSLHTIATGDTQVVNYISPDWPLPPFRWKAVRCSSIKGATPPSV